MLCAPFWKGASIIDRLRYLLHIVQAPKYIQCFAVILSIINLYIILNHRRVPLSSFNMFFYVFSLCQSLWTYRHLSKQTKPFLWSDQNIDTGTNHGCHGPGRCSECIPLDTADSNRKWYLSDHSDISSIRPGLFWRRTGLQHGAFERKPDLRPTSSSIWDAASRRIISFKNSGWLTKQKHKM